MMVGSAGPSRDSMPTCITYTALGAARRSERETMSCTGAPRQPSVSIVQPTCCV